MIVRLMRDPPALPLNGSCSSPNLRRQLSALNVMRADKNYSRLFDYLVDFDYDEPHPAVVMAAKLEVSFLSKRTRSGVNEYIQYKIDSILRLTPPSCFRYDDICF
ncbi:hypothetical protein ACJMK2_016485 [Sinanodonta woodiana]|uniref:Uncharacterized protein n=1 Tax=Sinanodonta woodiana TaxID=1069815 RepID=A0ABD3UWH8_SINWO